ncbi:solute carrier organic anion transporter family member 1A4-like [Antedon mediterranea]|uniref:solute carrier organic anion transporter family member 1A4-like n=1 Tax=Antedon mediterranea TaxID=105859 RepID=UPI003AF41070
MDEDSKLKTNKDGVLPSGNVLRTVSTRSDAVLMKEKKDDDNDDDAKCVCDSCTPSWLQCFKGVKFFTFVTLFALLSKVFASTYFGAVVSTLERQFNMDSVKSGVLLVINDMMDFIFVIFITHFGHSGHRPRWIATGLFMAAMGCFLCIVPHIMTEYVPPEGKNAEPSLCSSNAGLPTKQNMTAMYENEMPAGIMEETEGLQSMWSNVFWLMLGQILIGIGNTPLKPLGTTYIDDSVEDHKTGFYVAMLFLATPIGAIIGYFTSFMSLRVYVDFDRISMEEWPQIPRSDPRWIGAWWFGFAVASALLAVSAIPFLLFPKEPIECRKKRTNSEAPAMDIRVVKPKRKKSVMELIKGLLQALKRMATNPAMVFICLSSSSGSAAYAVSGAFGIKYFVDEFGKSNSSASLVGIAILPVLILAYLIGGYVIKRWKLNAKQCALFGFFVDAPSCLMYFLLLFVGCPNSDVAGVTVPYTGGLPGNVSLIAECNNQCGCPEIYNYEPLCINNVTFMSPCHAGCTVMEKQQNSQKMYSNCTCDPDALVQNGACPVDDVCNTNFMLAVLLIIIALGTSSLGRSADIIVSLRCVDKEDRSLALGIKIFIVNILAFFPSPVYFGALLNWTCLEFAYKPTGERGACLVYDRTRYRHVFYGMYTVLHLCALFCWLMVYFTVEEKNKGMDTPNEANDGQEMNDFE